jgi:hypothetical protein
MKKVEENSFRIIVNFQAHKIIVRSFCNHPLTPFSLSLCWCTTPSKQRKRMKAGKKVQQFANEEKTEYLFY